MKQVRWFFFNGIFAAAIWFGLVGGIEGARNVAQFIAWLVFVTSLAMLSADTQKKRAIEGYTVPLWFDVLFDTACIAAFVWYGWWWTAGAYVTSSILIYGGTELGKELLKKEAVA